MIHKLQWSPGPRRIDLSFEAIHYPSLKVLRVPCVELLVSQTEQNIDGMHVGLFNRAGYIAHT